MAKFLIECANCCSGEKTTDFTVPAKGAMIAPKATLNLANFEASSVPQKPTDPNEKGNLLS